MVEILKLFLSFLFVFEFFLPCSILKAKSIEIYQERVNRVSFMLIYSVDKGRLNLRYNFNPEFNVYESNEPNAYAGFDMSKGRYYVKVSTKILSDVVGEDDNLLAFILGHEIAHIICGHVDRLNFTNERDVNVTFQLYFSREDEIEADMEGLKLCAKAGYSPKKGVEVFKIMRRKFGDYSSLEANSIGHPSFTERLELVDKGQEKLWRAMNSFTTGVEFLNLLQYDAAIVCFEKVIEEFPNCYEAYNNLGYANLMKYIDNFDLEDYKRFNVGVIVIGGFYRTPSSLEGQIRGIDENLYWRAINYFNKALTLAKDSAIINGNLGVAYLLDPRQKIESYILSRLHFQEALRQIKDNPEMDPLIKAVISLNASNVEIAQLRFEEGLRYLYESENYVNARNRNSGNFSEIKFSSYNSISYNSRYVIKAAKFNFYVIKTRNFKEFKNVGDLQELRTFILELLRETDKSSLWWQYFYRIYLDICSYIGQRPLEKEEINRSSFSIPPRSLLLKNGKVIYISQRISEVNQIISYSHVVPIVKERRLNRYIYPDLGIEIVGGERVILILIKPDAFSKGINIPNFDFERYYNSILYSSVTYLTRFFDENDFLSYYFTGGENLDYVYCYDLGVAYYIENGKVNGIIIVEPPKIFY